MAQEFFNWKGLFINEDPSQQKESQTPPKPQPTSKPQPTEVRFPDQPPPQAYAGSTDVNNPFLQDVLSVYEKGFESLNSQGFDFFEMYRSVMAVGVTNPQSYQMAFTMGKTINPTLTKDFLIEKARYYISEIEKVYTNYDAAGRAKKANLDNTINSEKANLSKSIADLEAQIVGLQNELEAKKAELLKTDSVNREQFNEIQLKIDANNLAKNRILESINTVLTGINQYL